MSPFVLAAMILLALGMLVRLVLVSVASILRWLLVGCAGLALAGFRRLIRHEFKRRPASQTKLPCVN
jgi:hypothetical protein